MIYLEAEVEDEEIPQDFPDGIAQQQLGNGKIHFTFGCIGLSMLN